MKRLISSVLLLALLSLTGCVDKNAQAKQHAQQLADRLGRTPVNSMTEFATCGAFVCTYDVYFTTFDSKDQFNARVQLIDESELQGRGTTPANGAGDYLIDNLDNGLRGTNINERLALVRGMSRPQSFWEWNLSNKQGKRAAFVRLYPIRESSTDYEFGGKPLKGDLVYVSMFVNPRKP